MGNKLIAMVMGISMLFGCQNPDQRAKELEMYAIDLFKKGEYSKAEQEFNNVLKQDGTLANTYYYLALLNEKNRSYIAMRENLIQAVKFSPEHLGARIKLGKTYLLFNDLDAALIEAEEILTFSKDNVDGMLLKAAVLIKQKKHGNAMVLIENILQKQPNYIEAISLKALVLLQNEQFNRVLNLVNPVIDSGVDDVSLQLLKIQLDTKQKNIDDVIADYERLAKQYPKKRGFTYALAKIYSQANRKQDAEKLLRSMVDSTPLEIQPKLMLLDFLNTFNKERAISLVKTYSFEHQDKPEILLQLSKWLLQKLYLPEAKALLIKIDNSENSTELNQQIKLLLAKAYFHNKELNKSKTILDKFIPQYPKVQQARILKAKIQMVYEKYDKAERLLAWILQVNPTSDESFVLQAQIEIAKGYPQKADTKYRQALEANPANISALIPVVRRSLKHKAYNSASELVIKALKLKPNNLILLRELAEIKMLSRDWNGAKVILESLEKHPKGVLQAKFLMGKVYKEQGDCPQSVSIFKELLGIAPDFPDVLRQMATCHEDMSQRSKMIDFITAFMEKNPNNIVAYLVKGQLLTLENKLEEAVALYKQALDINKKVPQVYAALAKLYSKQKKHGKVIETYKFGLEQIQKNVRLSIYLASFYKEIHRYSDAAAVYESLLADNPKLDIAINNYAVLLVDFFADKQSIAKARKLVMQFKYSENPFFLDSFAWIELKSGNVNEAVVVLEKINEKTDLAVFKFHLGVAYHEQGKNFEAIAQLQQAIDLGGQKEGFDEIRLAQQLLDKLSISQ